VDDGGGNGGGSFKVEHGSDAAEIPYMHVHIHVAGVGEVGDVVGEREMRIKVSRSIWHRVEYRVDLYGTRLVCSGACISSLHLALNPMLYCITLYLAISIIVILTSCI